MSRIVITTIRSLGDLHPKIAIAIELGQRSHNFVKQLRNLLENSTYALTREIGKILQIEFMQYFREI